MTGNEKETPSNKNIDDILKSIDILKSEENIDREKLQSLLSKVEKVVAGQNIKDETPSNEDESFSLDHFPTGSGIIHDGKITLINDKLVDMTGYSKDEILSWSVEDVIERVHPEERDFVLNRYKQRQKHIRKNVNKFTVRFKHKSGGYLWFDYHSNPINIGNVRKLFFAVVESVNRRQYEVELKRQKDFTNAILNTVGALVVVVDHYGKIVAFNSEVSLKTGYTLDKMQGKFIWELNIVPEDIEKLKDLIENLKTGKYGSQYKSVWHFETGDTLIVSWISQMIRHFDTQTGFSYEHEVTDALMQEVAQAESEQKYSEIFENSPVAMWEEDFSVVKKSIDELKDQGVKDFHEYFKENPEIGMKCLSQIVVVDVNQASVNLYRAPSKETLLGNFNDIFWEDMVTVLIKGLAAMAEGDTLFETEIKNYTFDKQEIFVCIKALILPAYEDTWSKVIVTVEDLTDRMKIEKELSEHQNRLEAIIEERTRDLEQVKDNLLQQERFATLGHLTAVVSHELRNPLGTIRSSVHVLEEQIERPNRLIKTENVLSRIERNILRCDQIIEELLDYTRQPALNFHPVAIDDLLDNIADEYNRPSDVNLKLTLAVGKEVSLDKERFRRCIINLLDNACLAMSEIPVTKEKCIDIISKIEDEKLHIQIIDNGPGIPEDDLDKVVEPLYSTRASGIGLGLSIVSQIMEQHNGELKIESEINKGTVVNLYLPRDL